MRLLLPILAALLPLSDVIAGNYKIIEVKDGGVIRGTVTVGKAPTRSKAAGGEGCPAEVPDEAIQGDPGRLANAVVYIKKVKAGKAWSAADLRAVTDQRSCVYKPHVTLVGEGGTVRFLNSDSVLHNVRLITAKNGAPTQSIKAGEAVELRFPRGHDVVELNCPVHPFMSGYVIVMDHPYYARTGADGRFILRDVPAGAYLLKVWHPTLREGEATVAGAARKLIKGTLRKTLELSAGGDVVVNIAFAGGALTGLTPPAVEGGAAPAKPAPAKPAPAPKKPSAEKPKKPAQPGPAVTKPAPSPEATTPPPASEKRAATMAPISPQRERTPSQDEARDQHKKEQRGVVALPDNSKRLYLLILIAVLGAFLAPFYGLFGAGRFRLLRARLRFSS